MWKKSGAWFLNSLPNFSSSNASSIPSINSPANESTISAEGEEYVPHSSRFRSPSPVIRRKTRSPSPRTNRNRSPQIAGIYLFIYFF